MLFFFMALIFLHDVFFHQFLYSFDYTFFDTTLYSGSIHQETPTFDWRRLNSSKSNTSAILIWKRSSVKEYVDSVKNNYAPPILQKNKY